MDEMRKSLNVRLTWFPTCTADLSRSRASSFVNKNKHEHTASALRAADARRFDEWEVSESPAFNATTAVPQAAGSPGSAGNSCACVGKATARPLQESDTQRRVRESQRVDERITVLYNIDDFRRALKEVRKQAISKLSAQNLKSGQAARDDQLSAWEVLQAGSELVVLEVESPDICQTGADEEPEVQYKVDQEAALAPCKVIKHVFQRTARDSPDVRFLALEADTEEGQAACKELGVEVIPTVQFWKEGQKLWEHRGIVQLENDLGEGVLFYGDTAANNVRASDHVDEIRSRAQLNSWLEKTGDQELSVLNVSLTRATPCVHVFPAVLALAKNMVGYAAFSRLMADSGDEAQALAQEFKVTQVPTFIFFRKGKEVGRHVGSSRGDLIGQILMQQQTLGLKPPPVPTGRKAR